MTDDLVKRLREVEWSYQTESWMPRKQTNSLQREAADRIEALEAALRFYAFTEDGYVYLDNGAVALAALGEKKDD